MNARQIAKCRKKISSKDYLRRRAELLEEQCIRLFHFLANEKRMTDNSKSIFIDKTNERTIV